MSKGRKLFDGKDYKIVIEKLEQVWAIGGSDKEASFYANIDPSALSRFLKTHLAVSQRKDALKNKPILKARQEVVKGLDNNPEFSLKFLERKLPKEFCLKSKLEHTGDSDEPIKFVMEYKK